MQSLLIVVLIYFASWTLSIFVYAAIVVLGELLILGKELRASLLEKKSTVSSHEKKSRDTLRRSSVRTNHRIAPSPGSEETHFIYGTYVALIHQFSFITNPFVYFWRSIDHRIAMLNALNCKNITSATANIIIQKHNHKLPNIVIDKA